MTIGEKLTKLRKEQNLTQEQFAELLNVSRQSVSKWELGTSYPETEKLIRISKLFGCSMDYLLKDEVEQMDLSISSANDEAHSNRVKAAFLTYLSFPPLFGFIVAIFSMILQLRKVHNKTQIFLTVLGFLFSLELTTLMVLGIVLEL